MKTSLWILLTACVAVGVRAQGNMAPGFPYPEGPMPYGEDSIAVAQPDITDVSAFQDQLSPYGEWVDMPPYGMVWKPAILDSDPCWRPYYVGGHWVWTSFGWYWQSDYPWGWATFHYGRWLSVPTYRWVWVPDCTWGPAWVTWRYSSDYCGWAPLPPSVCYRPGHGFYKKPIYPHWKVPEDCYVFVPPHKLHANDLSAWGVSYDMRHQVYATTIAPRQPYGFDQRYLINQGPPKEAVGYGLSTPLHPATIAFGEGKPAYVPTKPVGSITPRGYGYDKDTAVAVANHKPLPGTVEPKFGPAGPKTFQPSPAPAPKWTPGGDAGGGAGFKAWGGGFAGAEKPVKGFDPGYAAPGKWK